MKREEILRISPEELAVQSRYAQLVAAHPGRPESYHIVTYGCQMNERDSQTLAGSLIDMGLRAAARREEADLVLFNTCCIRENAERRALGNITWLKEIKRQRPGMLIGVCGCMMQQRGMAEKVLRQYPFVDLAFGTGNLYRLPEYLYQLVDERRRIIEVSREESTLAEGLPSYRESACKAFVNIVFGCDNFCSYCIVPYVRGRERSRRHQDILREVEALVQDGVKEVTLLGQNVNSYGKDAGEIGFPELLRRLEGTGIERLRFMTSHPKDLSDELIGEMARNPAVAPHLHLPVQSGSDRVLKLMNRGYTAEHYLEKLRKLREAVPDIGISSDLIVGFPGETREDFEQSLQLVNLARYDSAFTFIFSPRAGTRAATMGPAVPPEEANERLQELIRLQESISNEMLLAQTGQKQGILVEGPSLRRPEQLTGKSGRNISVNFTGGDDSLIGSIVPVIIKGAGSNTLRGEYRKEDR